MHIIYFMYIMYIYVYIRILCHIYIVSRETYVGGIYLSTMAISVIDGIVLCHGRISTNLTALWSRSKSAEPFYIPQYNSNDIEYESYK